MMIHLYIKCFALYISPAKDFFLYTLSKVKEKSQTNYKKDIPPA